MFDKYRAQSIARFYMDKYDQLRRIDSQPNTDLPDLKSLLNIYIEPTNLCNLNCTFCARGHMEREIKRLTLHSFQRILEHLPSGSYLTLTGNGEPLLNPQIYEMIRYASNAGMFVSSITNATALIDQNQDKLIDSGVSRIQISFQSMNPVAYEAVMQNANFRKTLENVLSFIKKTRTLQKKIFISVCTVKVEESKRYAAISKKFWEKMPIDNYYEGELLSLQSDSSAYGQCKVEDSENYLPCATPWIAVKVNADGSVNPCVHDFSSKYSIGNVNENSLVSILNTDKAKRFRAASLRGDWDYLDEIGYHCRTCNTWTRKTGGNICSFLENSFPVRLGLVINEVAGERPSNTEFLERVLDYVRSGKTDIISEFGKELEND